MRREKTILKYAEELKNYCHSQGDSCENCIFYAEFYADGDVKNKTCVLAASRFVLPPEDWNLDEAKRKTEK